MTATLYHGPGSRDHSLQAADDLGVLVAPAFGDEKLSVEHARDVVRLVIYPQAVDKLGVIVVGLDHAAPKTQDVLLKVLEEHDPSVTRILLWATDAESVSPTVRSRCLETWCPPTKEECDKDMDPIVISFTNCVRKTHVAEALSILLEIKGQETAFLNSFSYRCKLDWDAGGSGWWEKIRPIYDKRNPTHLEVVAAFTELF